MVITSEMNKDIVELRRAVGDDRDVLSDVAEMDPQDREIINLYGYSMIWHGLGSVLINRYFLQNAVPTRVALVIGISIPMLLGANYVISSHRKIARYLTKDPLENGGSDYRSVQRAPPARHILDDGDE